MSVFRHVCRYVFIMYVCMYCVYIHGLMGWCVYVYIHAFVCVCMFECMRVFVHFECMRVFVHVCMQVGAEGGEYECVPPFSYKACALVSLSVYAPFYECASFYACICARMYISKHVRATSVL